ASPVKSSSMLQSMKSLGTKAAAAALDWLGSNEATNILNDSTASMEFELRLAERVLASIDWSNYAARSATVWTKHQRPLPSDAKSPARLAEARSAGLEALDCGLLRLAALRFSECIRHAQPGSSDLAVAFANRSLVFKRLGCYAEAIADAEAALRLPYGDERAGKLTGRIADCQKRMSVSKSSSVSQPAAASQSLLRDFNPQLPHASAKLQLALADESRGRCLVALEDVDVGDLLVSEPAFSAILLSNLRDSHCSACLAPCQRLLPCSDCSVVGFCSETCRDNDPVHRVECGWLAGWLDSAFNASIGRLAFATVIAAGGPVSAAQAVAKAKNFKDFESVFGSAGDYQSVLALVAGERQRESRDLAQRVAVACQMALLLSVESESNSQLDVAAPLVAALLRHLMLVPCNAHDVTALSAPPSRLTTSSSTDNGSSVDISALTIRDIGSAVYPTASLINHSCDPNVSRVTCPGLRLEIRALRPIAKGEELLDNYGLHWAVHPKQQRQESLAAQYLFDCDCVACTNEWPLYDGLLALEPRWIDAIAKDDKSEVEGADKNNLDDVANFVVDPTIKAEVESTVGVVAEFVSSFSTSAPLLANELNSRFEARLLSLIRLLQRRVRRPHRWFNDAEECVKMVWSARGCLDTGGTD
ncbi:hypothetical protein BOX15_Mlig029511g1, partial [Macrostomum lignano]